MNASMVSAAALFVGSLVLASLGCALFAGSPALAASAACASGYHADATGNCQPNNGSVDSRCQNGFEAIPAMNGNGYRCVRASSGS